MGARAFLSGKIRRLTLLLVAGSLVLAAQQPAAALSREGTWKGPTSQGKTIVFKVNADQKLTYFRVTVVARRGTCQLTATWSGDILVRIRDDDTFRFKATSVSDPNDFIVIKGEFTAPRRANGSLYEEIDNSPCGDVSARATWDARRQD